MLLKLSKSCSMTSLVIILLQTLTTQVASSPVRPSDSSASELNLLLDPIYQSEQDNQLESKRVVPKSVYNTVIRVTTTPCSAGSQRFKEGGPCVTRYTGSGPVLDEEFQLSILKGITSLGGIGGSRRPSNNRNRNRHRSTTTTTPIPPTTTMTPELELDTVDEEPFATESPSESDDIRKVGNVEILDIEVESDSKPVSPELSPTASGSSSMITSQPLAVAPLVPQPGPRPASTPTSNNGSNIENVGGTKLETNLPENVDQILNPVSLSASSSSIIEPIIVLNSETTFPASGLNAGIKDDEDEEKTTEPIIDFSTTMMSTIKGEDVDNFKEDSIIFDVNPTQTQDGGDQEETAADVTTGQPLQLVHSTSSTVMPMGQNVMVNKTNEEDKATIKPSESTLNIVDQDPEIFVQLNPESEKSSETLQEPKEILTTTLPRVESTNPMRSSSSPAPATIIIPLVPELEHLPEILPTPLNFTEGKVNDTVMMDVNTRLPNLNVDSNPENVNVEEHSEVTTSPEIGRMIQISDFEMDPITATAQDHHLLELPKQASPSFSSEATREENADVIQEDAQSEGESLTDPNLDETLTLPNPNPISSLTNTEPEVRTSLAQEILSKLRPISHPSQIPFSSQSHQSDESFSTFSPTPSQKQRRWGFFPELVLDELESDLSTGRRDQSRQAEIEIDHSHHRSRNRVKSSEISSTSLIPPSHHEWRQSTEKVGGGLSSERESSLTGFGRSFPQMLAADYSRLGDNYRRFRVF